VQQKDQRSGHAGLYLLSTKTGRNGRAFHADRRKLRTHRILRSGCRTASGSPLGL